MDKTVYPDGVQVPEQRQPRAVKRPYYVRQRNGPIPHEDRVVMATDPHDAVAAFVQEHGFNGNAWKYRFSALRMDPESTLAKQSQPKRRGRPPKALPEQENMEVVTT